MESTHEKSTVLVNQQYKGDEGNAMNKGATNNDVVRVENSPLAVKVKMNTDPSDEGNLPSAVKTVIHPTKEKHRETAVTVAWGTGIILQIHATVPMKFPLVLANLVDV